MAEDWSRPEVEATVADYFSMLEAELRGEAYNKAEHRRVLVQLLTNRSAQSVEFKHANISAILIELGFPYIAGYKPRSNYQALLAHVLADRLAQDHRLVDTVAADAEEVPSVTIPTIDDLLAAFVRPPRSDETRRRTKEGAILPYETRAPRPPVNYLEREARNRALGLAGEEFVVRVEQARLIHAGHEQLAGRVEHMSRVRGDGLGFDILSFEETGSDRLIEVKTTKHGRETPFFVSRNEVAVSQVERVRYQLYRVFDFRTVPRLFALAGSLDASCVLEPASYEARVA